jgi:hypothetical protein
LDLLLYKQPRILECACYVARIDELEIIKFKVCKSVHHHTIQIKHQLDATVSPVYYPDVYLQLNLFRASSRPSSGDQKVKPEAATAVELLMMGVRTPETC